MGMPNEDAAKTPESNSGCLWLGGIAGVILLVSQCGKTDTSTSSAWTPSQAPTSTPEPTTSTPPPMTEQSQADIKLGTTNFSKAAAVDDATSAVIFSKNCYAALEAKFTWEKLDRCGAFDAAAAKQILLENMAGDETEISYLSEEFSAQRFINAGTSHGAEASTMDVRWDKTMRSVEVIAKRNRPKPKPSESSADDASAGDDAYVVDENGNLQSPSGE